MVHKKLLIRVDGNSSIGLGHIYRGIALADMLKDEFSILFLTRADTTISPIIDAKYNYKLLPEKIQFLEEPEWISINISEYSIIVIDGYKFDEVYQQKIKNYNFKLIYIDDLAKGTQKADLVINHCPGTKKEEYKTETYTDLALGLNFALLRKSFAEYNRKDILCSNELKNIFVSFGGADPTNFSIKTVNEILKISYLDTVNLVLGAPYKHDNIFKIKNPKLNLHKNLSEQKVFTLMKSADLAIVSASTTSIELASLGVPMVLGYYVDNQKNIYNGFVNKKAVLGIGDFNTFNFSTLADKFNFLNKPFELERLSKAAASLFSVNIKQNILKKIKANLISVRKATEKDVNFIYNLSNDPIIRSNSYNSEKIEFKHHKKWFKNQIEDAHVLFFIIEYENQAIGQVRFNIKDTHAVIGISIIDTYRGKGLSSKILKQATFEYFKENKKIIYAYIKKTNAASVKLFANAGFYYGKDVVINNIDSFLYIKDLNKK